MTSDATDAPPVGTPPRGSTPCGSPTSSGCTDDAVAVTFDVPAELAEDYRLPARASR